MKNPFKTRHVRYLFTTTERLNPVILGLLLFSMSASMTSADPPFHGTIFVAPDVITEDDPTSFIGLTFKGSGQRVMFDRRSNSWVTENAFLFEADFQNIPPVEIQVNPEFGSQDSARIEAEKYAPPIGRMPLCLLTGLKTVWIHKGYETFGGGNNNFLIHTSMGEEYISLGILEETFMHEGVHTSMDSGFSQDPNWLNAQNLDPDFISTYARDFPQREDMAESFVLYFAAAHRSDRISNSLRNTIIRTIPNRIKYFNSLGLNMSPQVPLPDFEITDFSVSETNSSLFLKWNSLAGHQYEVIRRHWNNSPRTISEIIPSQGAVSSVSLSWNSSEPHGFFSIIDLGPKN